MFPYVQFLITLFLVGALIAVPSTVRRVRANESDMRCTLPVLFALAAAMVSTAIVFLGFMFNAQSIKAESLTEQRAENVAASIQSEWSLIQGQDKTFDDFAWSSEDNWWIANKVALENGEKVSFTTKEGKEVSVQFTPSDKGSTYYNVDIAYDGNPVERVNGEYKESGKLPYESKDNWVNDYPTLNMKSVGQKA